MSQHKVIRLALAVTLAIAGTACTEDSSVRRVGGPIPSPVGDGGAPDPGTPAAGAGAGGAEGVSFCDALTVIRAKCQRCHGDPLKNGAPAPFLTYDDTQAAYYGTAQRWTDVMPGAVSRGFMPYVALNEPPTNLMPPVEALTEGEKVTLLAWLGQGALPVGGTSCP